MKFTLKAQKYYCDNILHQFNVNEFYYLRLLLLNVSNALFYKDLRIINDDFFSNYYVVYIIRSFTHNNVK